MHKKLLTLGSIVLVIIMALATASPALAAIYWSPIGSGVNDRVDALIVDASGSLYAGGVFTEAGGEAANNIAEWNGSSWSALGSGTNGGVNALAVSGSGSLYAGGWFTQAGGVTVNNIARWNGSSWTALGSGTNGSVGALVVDGSGNLCAGGSFTQAGGLSANNIARWNGSTWSALGSGTNGAVNALAVSGANLYAGGYFSQAGGVTANRIAKWNGSAWSAMGKGLGGDVYALAVDSSGNVYVGGNFTQDGNGVTMNHIAKWDGASWSALGTGTNQTVSALAWDGSGNLYAGGTFTQAGGVSVSNIARWNGSAWSALGPGLNDGVYALAFHTNLYAGGRFTQSGVRSVSHIGVMGSDVTPPTGISASEMHGVASDVWQNTVSNPTFTLSATDTESGVYGYKVCWDTTNTCTPTIFQSSATYSPGPQSSGTYYLRVIAQDYAGNESSATLAFTFKYDNQAPTGVGASETHGVTSDAWQNTVASPIFTLSASDGHSGVAGYKVCWDTTNTCTPTAFQSSSSYSPGAQASGRYYLRLIGRDNAGNETSAVSAFTFKYDILPPTGVGATETHGVVSDAWQNTVADPTFTLAASDDHSGVAGYKVCWDMANTCTPTGFQSGSSFSPGAQSSGRYYLRLIACDNTGNESAVVSAFVFKYDNTLPVVYDAIETHAVESGAWQSSVDTPIFTLNASDAPSGVAGYKVCWDTSDTCTPTVFQSDSAYSPGVQTTGTYYLRVMARDNAGNESAARSVFTFKYDGIPPNGLGAIETHGLASGVWQGVVNTPAFTLSASDAHSGVAGYKVCWDTDNACTPTGFQGSSAYTPGEQPTGRYYLRVIARDNAGNESAVSTVFEFRYDGLPPTGVGASETHGVASNTWQSTTNDPTFTLSASDAHSGVAGYKVCWDDENTCTPTNFQGSSAYSPGVQISGIHYLRVIARDNSGNESAVQTVFIFRYDGLPPTGISAIETHSVISGTWQSAVDTPVFTLNASDAHSGVAGYKVCWDETNTCTPTDYQSSSAYSPGAQPLGVYYLRVIARDNVGNESGAITAFVFKYDDQPPTGVNAIETHSVISGTWQSTVNQPAFTLSASDVHSGIAGYKVCWDTANICTPASFQTGNTYSPEPVSAGTYYLRLVARDNAGNESGAVTAFVFLYDGAPPTVFDAIEAHGVVSGTWQSAVAAPEFSLFATDAQSGVAGYRVCWDDDNTCTPTTYQSGNTYAPGAQTSGIHYLRVTAQDLAGNESAAALVFVFRYDGLPPTSVEAVETHGVGNGVWQSAVVSPTFALLAGDEHSGLAGFLVCWDTTDTCEPADFQSGDTYSPGAQASGTYYLRLAARDQVGNESATVTAFVFRYDLTPPSEPGAVETQSVISGTWQSETSAPVFTLSSSDIHSGLAGYKVCWDTSNTCTPTAFQSSNQYSPGSQLSGTHYLRAAARDMLGNESAPVLAFVFRYDGTQPGGVSAVETHAVESGAWQNIIAAPVFALAASDAHSGLAGYKVCWDTENTCTPTVFQDSSTYEPGTQESGIYYLRLIARDAAGNESEAATAFVFEYDGLPPFNLGAIEAHGVMSGTAQNTVTAPDFTLAASDEHSGMGGYRVCWDTENACDPDEMASGGTFSPGEQGSGTYYLRAVAFDAVGNETEAQLLFAFVYATAPHRLYLPVVSNRYIQMAESEPNDYFDQANAIPFPVMVLGSHDGAAGTGDVFALTLEAGQHVKALLETGNTDGVQLIVYNADYQEIGRSFGYPISVLFTAPTSGVYYLYLYTPPEAANSADYRLSVQIP